MDQRPVRYERTRGRGVDLASLPVDRLSDLEVAVGFPLGGALVDLPQVDRSPRVVLEELLREALERAPCVVPFSGGRDSSALLALAVHVARRDGLPEPVAVTRRHPDVEESDETSWQELVIRHLGVEDWERWDFTAEFDAVGPFAQRIMARFGPTWPSMAHSTVPFLERARGGSYVTGEGGDEMFGNRRSTVLVRLARRKERPGRQHLRWVADALGPRWLRARLFSEHVMDPQRQAWLRPGVAEQARAGLLGTYLDEPLSWLGSTRYELGHRKRTLLRRTLDALGRDHDVVVHEPLLDPTFAAALAGPAGRFGFCCRGCAMDAVFGDLLPAELLYRTSKADFTGSIFHDHTRDFVARWDGQHPLDHLVDPEQLAVEWRRDRPHVGTVPLLQTAWYAAEGR